MSDFHEIAERLETILMPLNYHPIFVEAPDKTTRFAWGNDPGEDKLPHGPHSRRIVLVSTDVLIVRSPSKLAIKADGTFFAWSVLLSSQIETFEEVLDLLSIPHLRILPPNHSSAVAELLRSVRNRCQCPGWDVDYNNHSETEHTNCGVHAAYSGPCGDCHECIGMQVSYYKTLEKANV